MKKWMWVVIAIVAILVFLVVRVISNLDSIVASVIENSGSQALGTEVTVSGVNLSLTEGSAAISGLTIANPDGWSRANAIELEQIEVGIDLASLDKPVIVINKVTIGQTAVRMELAEDGSSNMNDLLSGISSGGGEQEPDPSEGPSPDLQIKSLNFSGADVSVYAETEEGPQEKEFGIPGISMSNVQGSPAEVSAAVSQKLVGAVVEAAAREGVNRLIENEKEKLGEKLMDKLKGD